MRVICNGSEQDLADGATVQNLIEQLELEPRGLAVAVNDALVPKTRWSLAVLFAGDRVTVIRAAQGG